jgi:hypothetical protein
MGGQLNCHACPGARRGAKGASAAGQGWKYPVTIKHGAGVKQDSSRMTIVSTREALRLDVMPQ